MNENTAQDQRPPFGFAVLTMFAILWVVILQVEKATWTDKGAAYTNFVEHLKGQYPLTRLTDIRCKSKPTGRGVYICEAELIKSWSKITALCEGRLVGGPSDFTPFRCRRD